MYLAKTENLVFEYPDGTRALDSVSLEIREGEFVGVLGNNGSGKTTLAKCLAGLLKPTSGLVLIKGRDIKRYRRGELVRIIGYISQDVNTQLLNVSVLEEILFTPRILNVGEDLIKDRLDEILSQLEIGREILEKPVLSLPRHIKLRALLASYLLAGTKNFIVDEPTTGQDWYNSIKFVEFLRKLRENGATVILITHDVEILSKYSERVILMNSGRVVADGEAREILCDLELLRENSLLPTYTAQLAKEISIDNCVLTPEELVRILSFKSLHPNY
jgi:energy-coupling factor transporter ATP-binding protein EcfA2